jgi:hypothetical protein
MRIERFNESKDDIKFNWEKFKEYVNTYDPEMHGGNWKIILEDMLYCLGISIDENEFRYANGYKKFKIYLKDGVDWRIKKDANKFNL